VIAGIGIRLLILRRQGPGIDPALECANLPIAQRLTLAGRRHALQADCTKHVSDKRAFSALARNNNAGINESLGRVDAQASFLA
jgi:hypothetical protein